MSDLVQRAFEAFAADVASPPPLTLRGGNAIDGYDYADPFDPAADAIDDTYIEAFAFWGLGYLDARSLRHYVPHLIEYALRTPADPAMAGFALVRALRPPDRYPPRLATFTPAQEAVVREFLERVARGGTMPGVESDAQQALEEWWLPNPRSRPGPDAIAAMRAEPATYREVGERGHRLQMPLSLSGSGIRDIPQESRRVEVWGGYLCGDVHTVVAVNVRPVTFRSFDDSVDQARSLFLDPAVKEQHVAVGGAERARRFDGATRGDSPAEPQELVAVIARAGDEVFTLTLRTWPRDDVRREVERIVASWRVTNSSRTGEGEPPV